MTKLNCFNLEKFMEEFSQLEQEITEINGKNSMLKIMLGDANRMMKFYLTKEKSLVEEKDGLIITVKRLQQTLQEQSDLRVENERLKNDIVDLKQQNERTVEVGEAKVQQLLCQMRVEEERHQRELQHMSQQCSREEEDAHRKALSQVEAKDAEVKKLLEEKNVELEEMKKRLKEQEREQQSEFLNLVQSWPEFRVQLRGVSSSSRVLTCFHRVFSRGSCSFSRRRRTKRLQLYVRESKSWKRISRLPVSMTAV